MGRPHRATRVTGLAGLSIVQGLSDSDKVFIAGLFALGISNMLILGSRLLDPSRHNPDLSISRFGTMFR